MQGQISYNDVGVVIVPFPAQGHLNQLLHLSHIISSYGLSIHYAGSSTHNRQAKLRLHGWNPQSSSNIHFHDFQLSLNTSPPLNPDPCVKIPVHIQQLFNAYVHLRQPVSQLLQQLSNKFRRIVVIFDCLMASVVQDVKNIPNAESYAFIPISAFTSFFNSWDNLSQKPFDLEIEIPKGISMTDSSTTPNLTGFILNQQNKFGFESGWIFNSSKVIEGKYIQLLQRLSVNAEVKCFAIGPLNPVKLGKTDNHTHVCLEWLNKQEEDSVIYISFGSTTSMKDEQIKELAIGLEKSEQKFIWVLRRPDTADIFTGGEEEKLQLPEGYEERLKNRGMVIRDWAPQLEILAHPSVGGFVSHCGWNSCMESVSMGVPIAAWPVQFDQPRNAILVTEVLRIGKLVRDWSDSGDLVTSDIIENVVRKLMASEEGKEMRKRAMELGDAVRESLANGAEMDHFISHIIR